MVRLVKFVMLINLSLHWLCIRPNCMSPSLIPSLIQLLTITFLNSSYSCLNKDQPIWPFHHAPYFIQISLTLSSPLFLNDNLLDNPDQHHYTEEAFHIVLKMIHLICCDHSQQIFDLLCTPFCILLHNNTCFLATLRIVARRNGLWIRAMGLMHPLTTIDHNETHCNKHFGTQWPSNSS